MRNRRGGNIDSYVCCDCRQRAKRNRYKSNPLCPGCGKTMAWVGHDFATPKKSDKRGWDEVRRLVCEIQFVAAARSDEALRRLNRQHLFKKEP